MILCNDSRVYKIEIYIRTAVVHRESHQAYTNIPGQHWDDILDKVDGGGPGCRDSVHGWTFLHEETDIRNVDAHTEEAIAEILDGEGVVQVPGGQGIDCEDTLFREVPEWRKEK